MKRVKVRINNEETEVRSNNRNGFQRMRKFNEKVGFFRKSTGQEVAALEIGPLCSLSLSALTLLTRLDDALLTTPATQTSFSP